ncbi:MAG: DsbA family protein [Candidatus Thiodiazotropha sp. 'RUGA']|nr:DsbA family protein [Candidatus Thiodiazotropha sp. 'RUGA']
MSWKQHLYYIHDPMCSWCWAFRPTLNRLLEKLPSDIPVSFLLGGLAPDSDQPMDVDLRRKIEETWKIIQTRLPATEFNFDFWTNNTPRRSTYPACRSVIAVREIEPTKEKDMIYAIQQAYYLKAMNPSESHLLEELAGKLGISDTVFSKTFYSDATNHQLLDEIEQCRSMGVHSFPSLVFKADNSYRPISIDYQNENTMLEAIFQICN